MLNRISLRNLGPFIASDIDFRTGYTALTGPSGSGKSVFLGGLSLALGARYQNQWQQDQPIEISASFSAPFSNKALACLHELGIEATDELIIRRRIDLQSRSRAWLNDSPITLQTLKTIGAELAQVHSQHASLQLLSPSMQLNLLDHFGNHSLLLKEVSTAHHLWQSLFSKLEHCLKHQGQSNDRLSLLTYRIEEIAQLAPEPEEFEQLEKELQTLEQSESLIEACEQTHSLLEDLPKRLQQAQLQAEFLQTHLSETDNLTTCLKNSLLECQEALNEATDLRSQIPNDLERTQFVRNRVDTYLTLSRKNQFAPESLHLLLEKLNDEKNKLLEAGADIEALKQQLLDAEITWKQHAERLSDKRKEAASLLGDNLSQQLPNLGFNSEAQASIEVQSNSKQAPHPKGFDQVTFLFKSRKQLPPSPIQDAASGGELSRLALLIQSLIHTNEDSQLIVFDEIDSGVSGAIAEQVSNYMKKLATNRQVLSITHQPQVAAKADQHLVIKIEEKEGIAASELHQLTKAQRIEEVARLIEGHDTDKTASAHARALVKKAQAA